MISRNQKWTFASLIMIIILSCNTSITRQNYKSDITNIDSYVGKFYLQISNNALDSAEIMFASNLSRQDGRHILSSIHDMRGDIREAIPDSVKTTVVLKNGLITNIEASVHIIGRYDKGYSSEYLSISGPSFDLLKITGYEFALKEAPAPASVPGPNGK